MKQIHPARRKGFSREMDRVGVQRLAMTFSLVMLALFALYVLLHAPISLASGGSVIRYVAPTGEDSGSCFAADPCKTVQYAIDRASSGDEIRVAGGHYTGSVTIGKDLTLRGGFTTTNWATPDLDENRSTIDAQGTGRVIHVSASTATVDIRGFDLRGGRAPSGKSGGGVFNSGHLRLEDSELHDNYAPVHGGGIYNEASLVLRNSQVYSNSAQQFGGNIFSDGAATIQSSEIFSGSANTAGGGVCIEDGSVVTSTSNVFYANSSGYGGAIFVRSSATNLKVRNDTYYDNDASLGGAIYAYQSVVALTNTLIISNTASDGGGIYNDAESLTVSHNDFFGNSPDHLKGTPTISVSNRITDPQFVDPQGYDLHLSPGSPAIDAGVGSLVELPDFEGHGRPFGAVIDRGADEYTPPSACYARAGQGVLLSDTYRVYTGIQPAVDAVAPGSLVKVAGHCTDLGLRGGLSQTVYLSKSLTLRGGYTATNWTSPNSGPTVLDGQGLGRVIYVTDTASTDIITPVVENLHVTGGYGDYGAGVYVGRNVSITLQNNVIYRNEATQHGGGIYNQGSHVVMRHNTFYSNTASRGAAVFAGDVSDVVGLGMRTLAVEGPPLAYSMPPSTPLRLRVETLDPLESAPLRTRSQVFTPLTETLSIPPQLQRMPLTAEQAGLYLVQFTGPIRDDWIQALTSAGLEVVTYIPDYAYLVWGDMMALSRLNAAAPVRWAGVYHPYYALHPALAGRIEGMSDAEDDGASSVASSSADIVVQVYDHPGAARTIRLVEGEAAEVLGGPRQVLNYRNLSVRIAVDRLTWLASLPDVVNVEPLPRFELLDEVQGQIMAGDLNGAGTQPTGPGYLSWLEALGFSDDPDDYPIVDVTDDGIDDGTVAPKHADFYVLGSEFNDDRLVYNYNWTGDLMADSEGGHGNINASIVAGYNNRTGADYEDADGYNYGLGINPFGRVAGSKVFNNAGGWNASGSHADIIDQTYALGARISSNSWGSILFPGAYDTAAQTYDALVRDAQSSSGGNQEINIIFAAGNMGPSGGSVSSPSTAKNVLTVGAAENYRPDWTDGCGIGPSGANSAMDVIDFSGRGPADDGRVKPDVMAPGTHVIGAASQDTGYDGASVCDPYHPSGQTLYASSSGTSHSTPAVAGAASLVYRYYQDQFGSEPSPAMAKAYLVNATRYLDGEGAGGDLPSNDQGYGQLLLGQAFDGVSRVLVDQTEVLTDSGEVYEVEGWVADPNEPFRVTLAWTDAPGPTVGDAYVNNLDLELIVDGQTYRGNVFSGASSVTGGTADTRNNVESVFLPASRPGGGLGGPFTVRVIGTNVAGDGLPGNGDATDQDFALVVYNGVQSSVTLENSVVAENYTTLPGGGAIYASGGSFNLGYNDFYGNTSAGGSGDGSANYGNVITGTTDLSVPPGFEDPDGDDFHLVVTSELINAADPASSKPGNGPTTDFEGHERPLGTRSDIGADESLLYAELDLGDAADSPLIVGSADDVRGQTITFTHTITNYGDTGGGSDTILITTTNSSGWTVTLSGISSPVALPTGVAQTFELSVSVPDTITTVYNRTTITATSEVDDDAFDVAEDVIVKPGLALVPDFFENADPGEIVTYTHTLTNTGDGLDTFALSTSATLGWGELVTPTGEVTLVSGATAPVIARAQVPYTAPVNLEDVMTIQATSSYSVGISDAVTDTVVANPTTGDRFVAPSGSNTRNNCTDEAAPCATIAYAINQAAWGDTVYVAQGTYNEADVAIQDNVSLRGGYVFNGSRFSLPSEGIDPATTIIDAQGGGRGLRIQVPSGYHPLIKGFTIKNGFADGLGGAIYVQASSAPTLTHLILRDSSATRGGGIYVDAGSPILQHVTISGTVANDQGGGAYVAGGDVVFESVVISRTTAASGGGIYVAAGSVAGHDIRLSENEADDWGGGVYQAGGTLTLTRTHVVGNVASTGGGLYSAGGGSLALRNSLIYSNTANSASGGGSGGGVYKGSGELRLVNDTIYGNQATTFGGGVFESGSSSLVISNTIVATNTATTGGGLYRGGGGSASIDYNDFWGNTASSYPDSNVFTGTHTISADPLFADAAAGDFHIVYESPCVDAGDPDTSLDVDFEDDRRPFNQGFDIGADELAGCLAFNVRTGETYGVLQWAIDEAASSDVIKIAGTCRGVQPRVVNGQTISQTAFISKNLTLEGGYEAGFSGDPVSGAVTTTLDARGLGRALVVTGTGDIFVQVSRLRLTGGDAAGLSGGPGGGDAGGGVYNDSHRFYLKQCTITGNRATYGGGIYNAGEILALGSDEEGERTDVVSNTATYGGGIYNVGSSTTISQTYLYSNTADTGGGAYHADGLLSAQVITAAYNAATSGGGRAGGGIYNEAELYLQRGVVVSNTATNGAGLYNAAAGDLTIINTIVTGNSAATDGGGLYNLSDDLVVRHDTFYANDAGDQGGGVYHDAGSSSPVINSSLIVDNAASDGGGIYSESVDPSFDYNDVYGNGGGDYGGNLTSTDGSGNVSVDPDFISTDLTGGDFLRIPAGSPAEDAGDPASPVITDVEGDPRPTNQGFDIGADEVSGCYVRVNGQRPTYGSIQIAVGESSVGDKLHVAGTCQGVNGFLDGGQTVSQTVFLNKSLSIQGGYTLDNWSVPDPVANPTALDALGLGRVVYVTNTAVISVSGLHLRGGTGVEGGAIFAGTGVLTVTDSLVYSNTATHGGALYNHGGDVTLLRNEVYSNTATDGGAAYGAGGETLLDSNVVYGNQASADGGATYHAGGSAVVQNNVVRQNEATDGGGIYNAGSGLTVRHNTLYDNAATNGGGLYSTNGDPTVVSNAFADNAATTGHAIYGPASLAPDYNDAYPSANAYGGGVTAGTHSLSVEPGFVDVASGDFHLQDDSPLIDRGDPAMTAGEPAILHDFEGDYRPSDQGFDIGADERKGCWARIEREPDTIYGNPQRAIANSVAGDTIQITVGECRGVHPYDDDGQIISQTIHVTHNLTLHGGFSRDFSSGGDAGPGIYPDPDATTVDPQGLGRALLVTDGVSVTMKRLILVNGDAANLGGGPGDGDAGGLFYYDGAHGRLEHVDFYSGTATYGGALFSVGDDAPGAGLAMLNSWINYNAATQDGGAIYNASGVLTMTVDEIDEGTRVYSNTAGDQGGGVYNADGTVWLVDNNLTLDPVASISLNRADEGGFLYNDTGQAYLENNGVFENVAQEGGALYNASGQMTLYGNEIYDNEAEHDGTGKGGGLFNDVSPSDEVTATATLDLGNAFHGNASDGDGGAVYNNGGSLSVWNALIYENSARDRGGGIFGDGDDSSLLHNTLYANSATAPTSRGGAIYLAGGSPTIKNNVFDANTAGAGSAIYGNAGTLGYNDYWPQSGSSQVDGSVSIGTGNLHADPDYVDLAERDFHLKSTSPLIDVAQDGLGVSRDFERDPRPVNRGPDVGADEYSACLAQLTSTDEIYGRIQDALDDAGSEDTIRVAEGVCEESLTIDLDITISGSWEKGFSGQLDTISTTVDALASDRVATIGSGAGSVTISKMRFTNGDTSGDGGGIWSTADQLTLTDVQVDENQATDGGGIYLDDGTVTLEEVYVQGNRATGHGGGVYNASGSDVDVVGGGIYDNEAATNGGGIYNASGSVVHISGGSPIDGNQAQNGGGVYNSGATFTLAQKQINNNTAEVGGAIYASAGSTLDLVNLGLYGNTATSGDGGGLYRSDGSGSAALYHATVRENSASGKGGGVYNVNSSMVISASIVSGNTSGSGGSGVHGEDSVNVAYTLRWANTYSGVIEGTGNIDDENPHLRTVSGDLLYISPAIDAVPSDASDVTQDRVGQVRPQICAKDMGRDEFKVQRQMTWLPGTPDPGQATLAPQESVTYTYQLRNESQNVTGPGDSFNLGIGTGYTESITVTLSSSQGWAEIGAVTGATDAVVGTDESTFDLGPGDVTSIKVRVTVPPGTPATVEDDDDTKEFTDLTYEARQCPDGPALSETSNQATTRVEEDRQFAFVPDNFGAALPGQMLTYTHVITNTGNTVDTYSFFPKVGFYASAEIAQPAFGQTTLSPQQTATVVVSVTINPEAAGGLTDRTSVIAVPDADPSLQKAVVNNTTISYTSGTRYVSLEGQDSLVDESELTGTDYKDNNCTQPDVAACGTIQQAIDQAAAGDLIKLDQGVYTDVFTTSYKSQVVTQTAFVDESVTLQGGYDRDTWDEGGGAPPDHVAHPTILDPQGTGGPGTGGPGTGRALYVTEGVTVSLDRLIIRGGAADDLGGGPDGEDAGGGIYNEGAHLTLNADRIYSATADLGGGLYHAGGSLTMTNSLLHGNTVITDGGAVYAYTGTVTLLNSTFHDNRADGAGGAVYAADGSLVVTNTIFANNAGGGAALDGAPSAASLDYNLYHNNATTDTGGTIPAPAAPNDVLADPLFAVPGADPADLHLQEGSPARDAGDPATDTGQNPWDYENNARVLGSRVDVGAYEYVICPYPLTGVSIAGPPTTTVGTSTTFTADVSPETATTPVTYTWEATGLASQEHTGGGSDTADFTWPTTGTKTITVTAKNCGATFSATHVITVDMAPPVCNELSGVALDGPMTATLNVTAAFTASVSPITATTPITYTWQATGQAPEEHTGGGLRDMVDFSWSTAGTKTITVTALNGCGAVVSDTHLITVSNAVPVADAGDDQTVGPGDEVALDGSGSSDPNGDVLTYGWEQTGGEGVTLSDAGAESPTFTAPTSAGALTFTLTVTDVHGLADPTPDEVVVHVSEEPCSALDDVTFTAPPPTTTVGVATVFTANVSPVTATTPVTYTWQATGQTSEEHTGGGLSDAVDFSWPTTGTKTITVTAVNDCGTAVSDTHLITVTEEHVWIAPESAAIDGPTAGVSDATYTFTATVGPPTTTLPITFAWQATGQTPVTHADSPTTTDSVSFTWSALGSQTITMTASNVGGAVVATHTITVCYWADLDCDCDVDVADITEAADHWRYEESDPGYSSRYDLDGDGVVTVVDVMKIAAEWGWDCQGVYVGRNSRRMRPYLAVRVPASGGIGDVATAKLPVRPMARPW